MKRPASKRNQQKPDEDDQEVPSHDHVPLGLGGGDDDNDDDDGASDLEGLDDLTKGEGKQVNKRPAARGKGRGRGGSRKKPAKKAGLAFSILSYLRVYVSVKLVLGLVSNPCQCLATISFEAEDLPFGHLIEGRAESSTARLLMFARSSYRSPTLIPLVGVTAGREVKAEFNDKELSKLFPAESNDDLMYL